MKVSEAIKNRHSVRAFLNNPVSTELIKELLEQSSRCPSGWEPPTMENLCY